MHYDDYAQAIKYLKLALPEMNRHKVPVTPTNYSVWYEYSIGNHIDLVQAITLLKIEKKPFTQSINDDLYKQYIEGSDSSSLVRLNSSVRTIIRELIDKIQTEQFELNSYASSLELLSKEVEKITDLKGVESLIKRLIDDTHAKAAETECFKSKVVRMSEEVKSLDEKIKRVSLDANTDELTGIMNRRAFKEKISETLTQCKETNNAFSIVMVDIDHFKRLNDTHGHQVGDKVLTFIASLIEKNIRGGDYVARYGGEEFVIVLPNTSLENAICVGDNIRSYLSSQKLFDKKSNLTLGVLTLSMGVATFNLGRDDLEALIERADQCLYQAKDNGRNRTVGERDSSLSMATAISP